MAKKNKEIAPAPNQKYIDEYIKNEIDANRQMAFANIFSSVIVLVIWIAYIVGFFPAHPHIYIILNIVFPASIAILLSPLIFLKTNHIKKPRFKNFLIMSFIFVICVVNIVLPKHGLLGWPICLLIVNHYYNPKLGRKVFVIVLIAMLVCMYLGMLFGEYDPNTLSDGIYPKGPLAGQIAYPADADGHYYLPDSVEERITMLNNLLREGENRYLKAFLFYYLPRAAFVTITLLVSNSLNIRTYRLLVSEIRVNNEQQKMSTELNIAKDIQLATLPSEFVTNQEVEIMAELRAAKEVGGDFYDYFNLGDDHVAIVIGDVSGKGIPAAMFMMKTITCFKNYISAEKSPSQVMKEVNKTIVEGNTSQMFVTCFLAILNTKTGQLRYANAGHNPPIIGKNRNYRYLKCKTGFILGGLPDAFVQDEEITLEKGDSITLYTDGITEARNEEGKFYGEERLIEFFNSVDFTSVVHLHHELKDNVAHFVGNAEQSDDMTYITLLYHGDEYYYSEKQLPAEQESVATMLDFIREFCDSHSLPTSFKNNLLVVGDELISNIVRYGYKDNSGDVFLRLLYNVTKQEFIMTIIDTGEAFNQFEVNNSPIGTDVMNERIGGLGILIVKNIMDEYAYDRVYDKNIITLKKKI